MELANIYPCTEFEVSSFTHSRFTEGVYLLTFKNSAPSPLVYFVVPEMGLAMLYPCTKFEVSSCTRSKICARVMQWLDARGGVPKLARGSPSFYIRPHQIWRQYSRMVNALH